MTPDQPLEVDPGPQPELELDVRDVPEGAVPRYWQGLAQQVYDATRTRTFRLAGRQKQDERVAPVEQE